MNSTGPERLRRLGVVAGLTPVLALVSSEVLVRAVSARSAGPALGVHTFLPLVTLIGLPLFATASVGLAMLGMLLWSTQPATARRGVALPVALVIGQVGFYTIQAGTVNQLTGLADGPAAILLAMLLPAALVLLTGLAASVAIAVGRPAYAAFTAPVPFYALPCEVAIQVVQLARVGSRLRRRGPPFSP